MFKKINKNGSIESMLGTIEHNNQQAKIIREKLAEYEKAKRESETSPSKLPSLILTSKSTMGYHRISEKENSINLKTYIDNYRKISDANKEKILKILPEKDSYKYFLVIYRLMVESLKDIKEITDMKITDKNLTIEEIEELTEDIKEEKKKIKILQEILKEKENEGELEEPIKKENKIILAPNENGNIFALEDIKKVPIEHYEEVQELIDSIINGKFKRIKRLCKGTNVKMQGVPEVRGTKVRIVFERINEDTYALFHIFLKKTQKNNGYTDTLENRINEFKKVIEKIKANLENEEFRRLNDLYVQELYNKLQKDTPKKIKRRHKKWI